MTEEEKKPSLTLDDPVSQETLKVFEQLQATRTAYSNHLLDLEQEKVRVLRAAAEIDTRKANLFSQVLTDRGIDPSCLAEIDNEGKVHIRSAPQPPAPPTESAEDTNG